VRKSGLVILLVIFLITIAINLVVTDAFLENQLESALSQITGSRVEITGFQMSILSLEAGWKRLQVTDPNDTWTNIIETGEAQCDIALEPLLYGRWVIEELKLEELRSGTPRETDGALPEKKKQATEPGILDKTARTMSEEITKTTGFDFGMLVKKIDAAAIVSSLDLQSPANFDNLRQDFINTAAHLKNEYKSLDTFRIRSEGLLNKAQSINPENLKSVNDFIQAANTFREIRDTALSVKGEITEKANSIRVDYSRLQTAIKSVDNWIQDDIMRAQSAAKLPELNTQNIARMLFGEELVTRLVKYLGYIETARDYKEKYAPNTKVESPPRFTGQDIHFSDRTKWPKFWIKRISVSGSTGAEQNDDSITLSGSAQNISSNQKTSGQPAEIELSGIKTNGRTYEISALLDHATDMPKEMFHIGMGGISLNNSTISGGGLLPRNIEKGVMSVQSDLSISNGIVDGHAEISTKNTAFRFDDTAGGDRMAGIVRNVFQRVDSVDVNLQFKGKPEALDISISSTIDDIFTAQLKNIAGDEFRKGRAAIESEVRKKLEPEKQKLLALYYEQRNGIEKQLSDLEFLSVKNSEAVEQVKNRILARIDGEKNPLLKQALKVVRDLLK